MSSPTARRSSTCRCQLNVNENPYPPSRSVVDDITAAVAEAAATLNRYPDREFTELRKGLAAYLAQESGVEVSPDQVWAANGSNEVMLQLLQAFGGPGRTAISFAPTYSMYPEYARDAMTAWVAGRRHDDFSFDFEEARRLIGEHRPSVILLPSPEQPDRHRAAARRDRAAVRDRPTGLVVIDEAYAEFRRAGHAQCAGAAAAAPQPRRHAHDEQGVRPRRGPAGLPRRGAGDLRRPARRTPALPPLGGDAGRRQRRPAARRRAARQGRRAPRRAGPHRGVAARRRGFEVAESDANFVLFGRFDDRQALWQGLLDRGVLIRVTGPEGWLRVSVGTAEEMTAFKDALTRGLHDEEGKP